VELEYAVCLAGGMVHVDRAPSHQALTAAVSIVTGGVQRSLAERVLSSFARCRSRVREWDERTMPGGQFLSLAAEHECLKLRRLTGLIDER